MLTRSLLGCAVVFAVAMPMHALADSLNAKDSLNVKPGAWKMTITTLSAAGEPKTHTMQRCVTKKQLDKNSVFDPNNANQCTKKILSKSLTKIVYEQTCAGHESSTSKVTFEAKTPKSIVTSIDMAAGHTHQMVHIGIEGQWLSASCAGIK